MRKNSAAVAADMAVAVKQFTIVQRWDLVETFHRHRLAANRDDRRRAHAGDFSGVATFSPVHCECGRAGFPRDAFLGVIPDGVLPRDPAMRNAVLIQRENQGIAFRLGGKKRKGGLKRLFGGSVQQRRWQVQFRRFAALLTM